MIFTCPECDERLRGEEPGAVIACHACGNPVVVPAPPEPDAETPPPSAPVSTVRRHRNPWATAGIVLGIVAAAHVAMYLLLTMEARSQRSKIEENHTPQELAHAKQPEESPEAGTPEYRAWRDAYDRWLAAGEYRRHGNHVTLLRTGFLFSFLVQVCITGWIMVKVVRGRGLSPV